MVKYILALALLAQAAFGCDWPNGTDTTVNWWDCGDGNIKLYSVTPLDKDGKIGFWTSCSHNWAPFPRPVHHLIPSPATPCWLKEFFTQYPRCCKIKLTKVKNGYFTGQIRQEMLAKISNTEPSSHFELAQACLSFTLFPCTVLIGYCALTYNEKTSPKQ